MNALLRAFQEETVAADAKGAVSVTYDTAELAGLLEAMYASGRAAHPKMVVGEAAFGRFVARALGDGAGRRPEGLPAADLYFACACADGARGAATAFEHRFAKAVHRAAARILPDSEDCADAEQRVRQALLVGSAQRGPRIAEYRGQGPLDAWISVAAIRIAISLGRAESAARRLQVKALADVANADPERLYMKEEVRREMEAAVTAALGRLPARDRLVLGLYLVSGSTLQAIGKTLGISHQAVSKQIAKARDAVVDNVRATLADRLKIPAEDLTSFMRLVVSQLDANISRLLAKP